MKQRSHIRLACLNFETLNYLFVKVLCCRFPLKECIWIGDFYICLFMYIFRDLSHNEMTAIESDSLVGLKNLRRLILANNNIDIIQENAFKDLESLVYL